VTDRGLTIWGPFTDDELVDIINLVKDIEGRRPNETFRLLLNDENSIEEAKKIIEQINPLRAGYVRTLEVIPLEEAERDDLR
jgi:hypothetical protein